MSFGFSVGDFLAVGKLIADITSCLKEAGGSKTEYQDLVRELDCLQQALTHLERFHPNDSVDADSIRFTALSCKRPLEDFLRRLQRYDASLGSGAAGPAWKVPLDKVRFMLSHKDDIRKLQSYLSVHVGTLNILLAEHGLESMNIESKKSDVDRLHIRERLDHTKGILTGVQSAISQQVAVLHKAGSMLEALYRMVSGEMKASWMTLENSVASVCVSTQQIYRVVLEIHASVMNQPDCRWTFFQDPVTVEDALGRKFPVPSEYDFALLDQIIQHKFRTGPGADEVALGDYQLMESRRRSVVLSAESRLRPGSAITMAILVGKPPGVLNDRACPMPRCASTETSSVPGGGRVCCHCNVWFSETEKTRKCWTGLWDALAHELGEATTPRSKRLLDVDEEEDQSRPLKRPKVSHAQESDFKYVGIAQNTPDDRDVDRNTEALSDRSMRAQGNSGLDEALLYLDRLKKAFSEQPRRYNRFLDIMKLFKSEKINTVGVLHRVIPLCIRSGLTEWELLDLLTTFNNFLPQPYTIEYSTRSCSFTTPDGIVTVSDSLLDEWGDEEASEWKDEETDEWEDEGSDEEEGEQSGKDSELATRDNPRAYTYSFSVDPDGRGSSLVLS